MGSTAIANIYVSLIIKGKKAYSEVRPEVKAEVRRLLVIAKREDLIDE